MKPPSPSQVGFALGLVYVALLVGGVVAVRGRKAAPWTQTTAAWVAARDLAAGTQLDSADLAAPGDTARLRLPDRTALIGRHLKTAKRKGAAVSAGDASPFAMGSPRPGTIRFVLATRGGDAPALALARPDDRLSSCVGVSAAVGAQPTWDCTAAPFTVVALHRPSRGDSIWAVLEATNAEQAARFAGAASRLLIRR
jgi:hypothetical protein